MENMKSIEENVLLYTSAWNETEREVISKKIDQCWSAQGTFTDKVTETITGREAIIDLIIKSYNETGPKNFSVMEEPVTHHRSGNYRWINIPAEGYPAQGMDYFEFDEQNQITRIIGFF